MMIRYISFQIIRFDCVYSAQIAHSEPSIFSKVVYHDMSVIESMRDWPQSELVSSKWVRDHLQDDSVKIVKVIYDSKNRTSLVAIPGAAVLDWNEDIGQTDYEEPQKQDEKYARLLKKIDVKNEKTTIVLYSDFNNWFAAIVFWIFKHIGHHDVRLFQGGRQEWLHYD